MNIIILNKGNEIRHIKNILNRLAKEHRLIIAETKEISHLPFWFEFIWMVNDWNFYASMPQAKYYKDRALDSYGKLKHIIPWLPSMRWLLKFYKAPRLFVEKLKLIKPDLIISPCLSLSPSHEDFHLALAAKELGIPLIGFVPTWDSLTNKTFIHPQPDRLFVWNEAHKEQAIKYHGMLEDKVSIVGAYNFERFVSSFRPTRRDKFMKKNGLTKSFLLYLCSSPVEYKDETQLIENTAKENSNKQILVQFHPDKRKEQSLRETNQIRFAKTDSIDNYYYCAEACGISTSAFLEAGLFDKKITTIKLPDVDAQESIHFKSWHDANGEKIHEWLGLEDKLPSERFAEWVNSFNFSENRL